MDDSSFYQEIKLMFESFLSVKKDKLKLRIKNLDTDVILNDMNYSKVLFDSDFNIYKLDKDGKPLKVERTEFEVVVLKKN